MPFGVRDKLGDYVRGAVTAIFSTQFVKRKVENGLAFLQLLGHGDQNDQKNMEILQDVHHAQHVGFESFPTPDENSEGILAEVDGNLMSIAEVRPLPTALSDLVAGEARVYGEDAQSVLMKTGGDIEAEPKAGKHFKVGDSASAKMVLNGDNCDVVAAFTTWMTNVEAGIAAAGGGAVPPLVGTTIATVTGTSTKGKVE